MGLRIGNCHIILLTVFALLMMPSVAAADGSDILEIKKPPFFDASEVSPQELAKRHFALIGRVDAIYEDYVVVKDHSCELAGSVDTGSLSVGMFVGVKVDKEGKAVAIERLSPSLFDKR